MLLLLSFIAMFLAHFLGLVKEDNGNEYAINIYSPPVFGIFSSII